jgi:hypothetical protein
MASLEQSREQLAAASAKVTAGPVHVQESASQHAGTAASVSSVGIVLAAQVSADRR